jgi:nucleoside-diphosphate-sugar epimerase
MRYLVTGSRGFIGSHLVESLRSASHEVTGIDRRDGDDLLGMDLDPALDGVDTVFHLAAQTGVRRSWGRGFGQYLADNVLATQRLLEACSRSSPRARLVLASSSSVYGDNAGRVMDEDACLRPASPYGVTKVAAEALAQAYAMEMGVSCVILRYFTVYGPRQRSDMLIHRLCRAALSGEVVDLFGDGSAARDFTFVEDVVRATEQAATSKPGVYNVATGTATCLDEVCTLVAELAGRDPIVHRGERQRGDVHGTLGSVAKAETELSWTAKISLKEGLRRQLAWHRGGVNFRGRDGDLLHLQQRRHSATGSRIMFEKIFNVSLHRSGTQSVHDLLVRSGISSIHWPGKIKGIDYQDRITGYENDLAHVTATLAPVINMVTAVGDVPIAALYDHLDYAYPDSAFIMVFRNPFDWVRSVRRHIGARQFNAFERVQYWRYLPDRPSSLHAIEDSLLYCAYLTHHRDVLTYFSEHHNFLFVDLHNPEVGQHICSFLGLPPISLRHIDFRRGNRVPGQVYEAGLPAPSGTMAGETLPPATGACNGVLPPS